MNQPRFCPQCGEDLRAFDATPATPPPQREVIRREVTSAEVERLWGLFPLPFQMRPFGVVVEGEAQTPVALACETHEGKLWECAGGQTKMLETPTAPQAAAPTPNAAPASPAMTVPEHPAPRPGAAPLHNCMAENATIRENRGQEKYGR